MAFAASGFASERHPETICEGGSIEVTTCPGDCDGDGITTVDQILLGGAN